MPQIFNSTERQAVKFVKRLLKDNDVAAALQSLDQLCRYETQRTPAQGLKIDSGQFQSSKLVTDGEQLPSSVRALSEEYLTL